MARETHSRQRQLREQIAQLAARLIAEDGIDDWGLAKKKAARTAFLTSRFNTMFSIPMLFGMLGMRHFADLL